MNHNGKKRRERQGRRYFLWAVGAAAVILLAAMPMLAARQDENEASAADVFSATAEIRDIDIQILGGGQLSSGDVQAVKIPENVKLTEYLVGNGDVVSQGDALARVDKVSVMEAITQVQESLDYLSGKIAGVGSQTTYTSVTALTGGTVKAVYASPGQDAQDVMLEHGALAVLSLDGMMGVQIDCETSLVSGDSVGLAFQDGTEVSGRVKSNQGGVLTVTLEDKGYAAGTQVTVTADGSCLGVGELYIPSVWNAAAYSGTVSGAMVKVGDRVYAGQTLFSLTETGFTAQYQQLLDQRQEYEELMRELFRLYRTETVTAEWDGIVTGVDEDAYLLRQGGEGWIASLLTFSGEQKPTGFSASAVRVSRVRDDGMLLQLDPAVYSVENMEELSTLPVDCSQMTASWNYTGDCRVYTQDDSGILTQAGQAKPGDLLLAVGNDETVLWFVVWNGASQSPQTGQQSNLVFLSDTDWPEDTCTGDDSCTAATHQPGCPKAAPQPEVCTGDDTCTAATHQPGCPKAAPQPEVCTGDDTCTAATHQPGCPKAAPQPEVCTMSDDCTASTHQPGCPKAAGPEPVAVTILTEGLNQGILGESYASALQAWDGTTILAGSWSAEGLPEGLTIAPETGLISGVPTQAGSFPVTVRFLRDGASAERGYTLTVSQPEAGETRYTGYAAQITEIGDGQMRVKQTAYSYSFTDPDNPPAVTVDPEALTQEAVYSGELISGSGLAVNDLVLVIVREDGALAGVVKQSVSPAPEESATLPQQGEAVLPEQSGAVPEISRSWSLPSGGSGMSGGSGTQTQTDPLYGLGRVTVASVTSQERMTVSISVDELDITKLPIGQPAVVTVDALGGRQFAASVTGIAGSGTNQGGNSKFAVTVTLEKSGDMLPGMHASVSMTLETARNVTCIPVAALEKSGTKSIVYTSRDSKTGALGDPVPVTIGKSDGEMVEILSGLEAGDTCYYTYYDTFVESQDTQQSFSMGGMFQPSRR